MVRSRAALAASVLILLLGGLSLSGLFTGPRSLEDVSTGQVEATRRTGHTKLPETPAERGQNPSRPRAGLISDRH